MRKIPLLVLILAGGFLGGFWACWVVLGAERGWADEYGEAVFPHQVEAILKLEDGDKAEAEKYLESAAFSNIKRLYGRADGDGLSGHEAMGAFKLYCDFYRLKAPHSKLPKDKILIVLDLCKKVAL